MARAKKAKQLNFRITEQLANQIEEQAEHLGVSSSEFIRLAIKLQINAWLNPLEEEMANELKASTVKNNEKQ